MALVGARDEVEALPGAAGDAKGVTLGSSDGPARGRAGVDSPCGRGGVGVDASGDDDDESFDAEAADVPAVGAILGCGWARLC